MGWGDTIEYSPHPTTISNKKDPDTTRMVKKNYQCYQLVIAEIHPIMVRYIQWLYQNLQKSPKNKMKNVWLVVVFLLMDPIYTGNVVYFYLTE